MKKVLAIIASLAFLIPSVTLAVPVGWTATTSANPRATPNAINGIQPPVWADSFRATSTTAVSTFAGGMIVNGGNSGGVPRNTFSVTTSGHVGINDVNPAGSFDFIDNAGSDPCGGESRITSQGIDDNGQGIVIATCALALGDYDLNGNGSYLELHGNPGYWDFKNSDVGINTEIPGAKLDITGVQTGDYFQVMAPSGVPTLDTFAYNLDDRAEGFGVVTYFADAEEGSTLTTRNVDSSQGGDFHVSPGSISMAVSNPIGTELTLNGLYTYMLGDNVGVGSTTPWAKLGVQGEGQKAGSIPLFVVASTTYATLFDVLGNGRVGIGTTTPGTSLSIGNTGASTINIDPAATSTFGKGINIQSGCFAVGGTCVTGGGASLTGTTGQTAYFSGTNTAVGTSTVFISTASNVGINTASPTNTLSVNGSMNFTGDTSTIHTQQCGVTCKGFDFLFPNSGVFRPVEASILGTNDVFFQAVPATSAGYGYLEAFNSAGLVLGTGNNTAPIIFRPNRNEVARITSAGNLGIGTTTPQNPFVVSLPAIGANSYMQLSSATANTFNNYFGTTASNQYAWFTNTKYDGAAFVRDDVTKNAWRLTQVVDATDAFQLNHWDTSNAISTNFSVEGNGAFMLGKSSAFSTPYTGASLVGTSGGLVGVGTSAPLGLLSVGTGSLTDSNLMVQISTAGAGTEANYAVNKNGGYGFLLGYKNAGSCGSISSCTGGYMRDVTADPFFIITNSTNVSSEWDSSGNVALGGTITDQTTFAGASAVIKNGLVGIGTTTPVANLQVTTSSANATTSLQFGKPNQNKGTCMTFYDTAGTPVYGYFPAGSVAITYTSTKPSGCQN